MKETVTVYLEKTREEIVDLNNEDDSYEFKLTEEDIDNIADIVYQLKVVLEKQEDGTFKMLSVETTQDPVQKLEVKRGDK